MMCDCLGNRTHEFITLCAVSLHVITWNITLHCEVWLATPWQLACQLFFCKLDFGQCWSASLLGR